MDTITINNKRYNNILFKLINILFVFFLIVCIYDPADKLLGIKVQLFALIWGIFLFFILVNKIEVRLPFEMVIYLLLFFLVPFSSIVYYYFIGNDFINFDGYQYMKTYLFVSIIIVYYVLHINLIKPAAIVITGIPIATIIILIIASYNPLLAAGISLNFGQPYGIVTLGTKVYSTLFFSDLPTVYFHSAELMILPLGYFTMKIISSKRRNKKLIYTLLLLLTMFGLYWSDTRNNILACLLIPSIIIYWYSKRKLLLLLIFVPLIIMTLLWNIETIEKVLSPNLGSNRYKLSFFNDYINIFSNTNILLFGQGLGSYFQTTLRGYVSVTELSYFEFFRRFGLILTSLSAILFLYPIRKLWSRKHWNNHYIYIVYIFLLIMNFFNPLLMSSSGMIIFSIILFTSFHDTEYSTVLT